MKFRHSFLAIALLTAAAIGSGLSACFHDSRASSSGNASEIRIMAVSSGKAAAKVEHVVHNGIGTEVRAVPLQTSAVSNGTVLGTVMNSDPYNTPDVTINTSASVMYRANQVTGDVDPLPDVYYATTDCSGQAFVIVGDGSGDSIPTAVFNNGGSAFVLADGTVAMVLKTDSQVSANAQSVLGPTGCGRIGINGTFFYQANPNVFTSSGLAGGNVGAFGFGPPS